MIDEDRWKGAPEAMSKNKNRRFPALNDWYLWSEVTRSVSPLPSRALVAAARAEFEAERAQQNPVPSALGAKKTGSIKPGRAGGRAVPVWSPASAPVHQARTEPLVAAIEPRLHRNLRRGLTPIDAKIDLHGMRQEEARSALHRFVAARLARGDRTVLVITGRGLKKTGFGAIEQRGVLRHMLPLWLCEPALAPHIAGYRVSAPRHGGEGAYYVRLKRPKP